MKSEEIIVVVLCSLFFVFFLAVFGLFMTELFKRSNRDNYVLFTFFFLAMTFLFRALNLVFVLQNRAQDPEPAISIGFEALRDDPLPPPPDPDEEDYSSW